MIVVDSSVWIGHLRDSDNAAVRALRAIEDPRDIIVGDLILLEVLQGARDERHAAAIEQNLRQFRIEAMLGPELAVQAARNFRLMRQRGVSARKTIDVIIGTFCIMHGHALLHADRDFEPMAHHLGLRIILLAGPSFHPEFSGPDGAKRNPGGCFRPERSSRIVCHRATRHASAGSAGDAGRSARECSRAYF